MRNINKTPLGKKWKAARNKRFAIISIIGIIVFVAAFCAVFFPLIDINKKTVTIIGPSDIIIQYGNAFDYSQYSARYESNAGKLHVVDYTYLSFSSFDPELIGNQKITASYADAKFDIGLTIIPKQLEKPQITLTDNMLSWQSIPNANKYYIYAGIADHFTKVAETLLCKYDLSLLDMVGQAEIKVCAISESDKYASSLLSNKIAISKLEKVEDITYSNGILSWNPVVGATSYNISINGTLYPNITSTTYTIQLTGGDNKIIISAVSENSTIVSSTPQKTTIKKLAAVEDISYSKHTISWAAITNAIEYEIYLDGKFIFSQPDNTFSTSHIASGVHTLGILAKSSVETILSSKLSTFRVILNILPTVDANGVVTLNSIDSEFSYNVLIDDNVVVGLTSTVNVNLYEQSLSEGNHTICIQLLSANPLYIDKTDKITVTKLETPIIGLDFEKQQLFSEKTTDKHQWYMDGEPFSGDLSNITTAGTYSITAKSVANASGELTSEMSTALIVTKLQVPQLSLVNEGIKTTGGSNVKYYLEGELFNGDLSNITTAGTYSITAKSVANASGELTSEMSKVLEVTKLNTPTISLDNDNKINILNQTTSYNYFIDGEVFDGDLTNSSVGEHEVYAKNIANEIGELSSEKSNSILIYITDIEVTITKENLDRIKINTITDINDIVFDISVDFYKSDNNIIDSITYQDKTEGNQYVSYNRNGVLADKIILTLKLHKTEGNHCVLYNRNGVLAEILSLILHKPEGYAYKTIIKQF